MSLFWKLRDRTLRIGQRPLVMGIVNVTPDSFSDGGNYFDPAAAVGHALRLVHEGADVLDIGGESTRPGSTRVAPDVEQERVLPVIETLAARYGSGRFFLLHRPRVWNETERVWMGFERKRGKLADLNVLLLGRRSDMFSRIVGDQEQLRGVRYVITLDSDSQLPRDSARELVATMEHPLNRPRFDAGRNIVTGGYGHSRLQELVLGGVTRGLLGQAAVPVLFSH